MKPTAKRIVLELLSATDGHEAASSSLVSAAQLLGVAENNVRVTLTRLVAAGTLEVTGRGLYKLGRATQAITRQVTGWRELEKQVRRWDGGWVCVVSPGARSDRAAWRRRDRALRLLGFRELERAMAIRPDNLDGGVDGIRERLFALGLESSALVFRATGFDAAAEARARALWDRDRLSASYVQTRERIDRWLAAIGARELERAGRMINAREPERAGRMINAREPGSAIDPLALRTAAREAFFFGGDVLRMIMFDPRLPEPLVDVAARRALVEAAKRLDTTGRRLWSRLVGMQHGLVITTEQHLHAS